MLVLLEDRHRGVGDCIRSAEASVNYRQRKVKGEVGGSRCVVYCDGVAWDELVGLRDAACWLRHVMVPW